MPYDEDQIANLEGDVDDLVTPTTEDVLAYSQDYDAGIVAASALQKSLNGGGGGGGSFNGGTITEPLHIWPSDPGFNPSLDIVGVEGQANSIIHVEDFDGNSLLDVAPTGAVTISPSDDALDYSLTVSSLQDGGSALMVPWYADLGLGNDAHKFDNYGTWYGQSALLLGQVGDAAASVLLTLQASVDTTAFITATDGSNEMFVIGPTGAVTISPSLGTDTALVATAASDAGQEQAVITVRDNTATFAVALRADGSVQQDLDTTSSFAHRINDEMGDPLFLVGPTGGVTISPGGSETLKVDEDEIGFFGTTPVAQQSVAIGINEIHAALVNLGLIVEAP